MPRPTKGEKRASYISRCISQSRDEGYSQKVAVGRCHGMWRTYGAAKKAIKKNKPLEVR